MSEDAVLRTHLLDLLYEIREDAIDPILGGGYGLYLKQQYLAVQNIRTLLDLRVWPPPRATNDLDLFLRVEVVTDSGQMALLRKALHRLGYEASVKYIQFVKDLGLGRQVKVDFLTGPAVKEADPKRASIQEPRVKPRPSVGLHARLASDAVAIEERLLRIPIVGTLSTGEQYTSQVLIPQAFTYLVMKLCAFSDRKNDPGKDIARHHALDLYRIVAMLTEEEYEHARRLSVERADDEAVLKAREIVAADFSSQEGMGVLRLREHELFSDESGLGEFLSILRELFPSQATTH